MAQQDLIEAVKAHALAHYDQNGWDFIVECWDDADIAEAIEGAENELQAIAAVASTASLLAERRTEVESTIW